MAQSKQTLQAPPALLTLFSKKKQHPTRLTQTAADAGISAEKQTTTILTDIL